MADASSGRQVRGYRHGFTYMLGPCGVSCVQQRFDGAQLGVQVHGLMCICICGGELIERDDGVRNFVSDIKRTDALVRSCQIHKRVKSVNAAWLSLANESHVLLGSLGSELSMWQCIACASLSHKA